MWSHNNIKSIVNRRKGWYICHSTSTKWRVHHPSRQVPRVIHVILINRTTTFHVKILISKDSSTVEKTKFLCFYSHSGQGVTKRRNNILFSKFLISIPSFYTVSKSLFILLSVQERGFISLSVPLLTPQWRPLLLRTSYVPSGTGVLQPTLGGTIRTSSRWES